MPKVDLRPADLRLIVEQTVVLFRGIFAQVEFEAELAADLPASLQLDPEQMKRVLINLIDNSIQAMGGEGTITIGTRHIPERGVFRIQVADDGPGIPEEDRDKLFLPYVSTKHRGTGLGLAIVNRIISDHAGTIRVEQNTPRGAAFVIEIPAAGGDDAG
jgi:two-component system nitrogen regulation sensor histidine kinase NtrY